MQRCKKLDTASLPVVGGGVEVRPSGIIGAGNGLFAARAFGKGDVVTFVDGPVVSDSVVRSRDPSLNTHVRTLMSHFLVVDALRSPQQGKGGGSFANDPLDKESINVRFEVCDCTDAERFGKVVVLRALRAIDSGEEIFVSYGPGYWRRYPDVAASARRKERCCRGTKCKQQPDASGATDGLLEVEQRKHGEQRRMAADGGSSRHSTGPVSLLTTAQVETLAKLAAGRGRDGAPRPAVSVARAMQNLAVDVTPTRSVTAAALAACQALLKAMWAMRNGRYDDARRSGAPSSSSLETDEQASALLRTQRSALHAPLAVLVVDEEGGVQFVLGSSGRMQPKLTPSSPVAVVALADERKLAVPVAFETETTFETGDVPGVAAECGDMLRIEGPHSLLSHQTSLTLPRASVMLALATTGLSLRLLDMTAFGVLSTG